VLRPSFEREGSQEAKRDMVSRLEAHLQEETDYINIQEERSQQDIYMMEDWA
jgi:hypothetical protein